MIRIWSWAALSGLGVPLALVALPASAAPATRPYDLDGDGKPDLVIGAPRLDHGSADQAGGIVVVPTTGSFYPVGAKVVTQSTKKVAGASEDGDRFGSAVASADFDRDGYADLAVGTPDEGSAGKSEVGAVTILYGSRKGVSGARSRQVFEPSGKEKFAGFGTALAAGDLDGDGYPDLAVGAPQDDTDQKAQVDNPASGTVTVLRGGPDGVRTTGSRLLRGVRGTTGQDYRFGSSLTIGDVDGTGPADVVVLSEGHIDDDDGGDFAGSASFCSGGAGGPAGCHRLLHSSEIQNSAAVVVGDVQGDARPEIVVGVPSSSIIDDVGHLEVLALQGSGASTSARATAVGATDLGLPGSPDADEFGADDFGQALAVGQLGGDQHDDLVVGAPDERVGEERAGRVFLVHGGAGGLAPTGNQAWDQDTRGVPGGSEDGDRFGSAVALLDRDGDGRLDLVVGAPGEDDEEGRVTVLPGTGTSFTSTGSLSFVLRDAQPHDQEPYAARFGSVLNG